MQVQHRPTPGRAGQLRGACLLLGLGALACVGCNDPRWQWLANGPAAEPATVEIPDGDTGFTLATAPRARPATLRGRIPSSVELTVLHVQIPRPARRQAEKLWNHLREDLLDGELTLRLRQNGMRVGVGHARFWDAVKAATEAIDGHRANQLGPIILRPGFPLGLELDLEPHEQTLFFVGRDGILSGSTWPRSRSVLRVIYTPDPRFPDRVHLSVVPEVRQRLEGWRWVRTEAGLWQAPKYNGRAFGAAGFSVTLDPAEFVVVAPGERAEVYGLIGSEFLTSESDGERFDSYVFLRPNVTRPARRDE